MSYTINYASGSGSFIVSDGTLNTNDTSLSLPGRNYPGYGSPVDQNMVSMLEKEVLNIKGNGKIMYLMDQVKQHIQMVHGMWVSFLIIKSRFSLCFSYNI